MLGFVLIVGFIRAAVLSYSLAAWVDGTCYSPCYFQQSSFQLHFL